MSSEVGIPAGAEYLSQFCDFLKVSARKLFFWGNICVSVQATAFMSAFPD